MREYLEIYKFSAGLRQYSDQPVNAPGLVECYNMVPRQGKLVPPPVISNPIVDPGGLHWPITQDWPFPQLFVLSQYMFLCTRLGIYVLSDTFVPTIEVGVDIRDTIWSCADYGPYVLFTNGGMVYVTDPTTGDLHPYGGTDIPVMGTVCDYKGQLVAGRPAGYDPNVVLWGEIGEADMTLSAANVAGYRQMPWPGTVLCVKRLGDYVIVYGDNGISFLRGVDQPVPTMGLLDGPSFGIMGAGAVGGDANEHMFISASGKAYKINKKLEITELGYEEFFAPMGTIMISYDPIEGDYYISNGATSYLLTTFGLGQIPQHVSSCQRYHARLVGTYEMDSDMSLRIETGDIDMRTAAEKKIDTIELSAYGDSGGYTIGGVVLYGSGYYTAPMRKANTLNTATCPMSGTRFRIRVRAASAFPMFYKVLDYANIWWQLTDKRFIRGPYAGQVTPGSDR